MRNQNKWTAAATTTTTTGVGIGIAALALMVTTSIAKVLGAEVETRFDADPRVQGWRTLGDASLFQWDSSRRSLAVTWDSAKPTSAFYQPLGTVLGKEDDFTFEFELTLQSVAVGTSPGKPSTFQLALGFFNTTVITATNFLRGAGLARDVAEFDYFPDSGFGATISPTFISSSNEFASGFDFPLELTTNDLFRVVMTYTSTNRTLATTITRNGLAFGPIKPVLVGTNFSDLRVDAVGVLSYNDAVLMPSAFDGSIRATGEVHHLKAIVPDGPVTGLVLVNHAGEHGVEFTSRAGWTYQLERTTDLRTWTPQGSATHAVIAGKVKLAEPVAAGPTTFYRVSARRP